MYWIFINIDIFCIFIHTNMPPNLSTLIELQFLSTWYVLDIYQHWYNSNFYPLDMRWISINLIQLQSLSTWYALDIYQVDTTPVSINLICLQIYQHWYDSILSTWYNSNFYQVDTTPISIHLICVKYLSSWYVLDIYQRR
jgi:uncharacterized membrane protein YbaN (DUF454 family)